MFIKKENKGIPFFAPFTAFPFCTAGITTRAGGVSEGYFSSLNLGLRTPDTKENLEENVRRVCAAFGTAPEKVISTRQEHTAIVKKVSASDAGTGITRPRFPEGVDGLVTNEPGLLLMAYFADCVPILLCDPEKKAVGCVHSGWRGTVGKIAAEAVRMMEQEFGSRPEDIYAAVGPHIGKCCFEVDAPVFAEFIKAFPEKGGFAEKKGEKYHIDLSGAVEYTLQCAGVMQISNLQTCTSCNAETFFSHRKTGGKRGCFVAVIGIN